MPIVRSIYGRLRSCSFESGASGEQRCQTPKNCILTMRAVPKMVWRVSLSPNHRVKTRFLNLALLRFAAQISTQRREGFEWKRPAFVHNAIRGSTFFGLVPPSLSLPRRYGITKRIRPANQSLIRDVPRNYQQVVRHWAFTNSTPGAALP